MSELRTNKIYPRDGLPSGASGGGIVQVVHNTSTTSLTTSSTSFVATALTATITPTSASNKVLVFLNGLYDTDAAGRQPYFALFRQIGSGSFTNITNVGSQYEAFSLPYNSAGRQIADIGHNNLDSPATTSAVTYTLYMKSGNANDVEFNTQVSESRITLMEVSG